MIKGRDRNPEILQINFIKIKSCLYLVLWQIGGTLIIFALDEKGYLLSMYKKNSQAGSGGKKSCRKTVNGLGEPLKMTIFFSC